MTVQGRLKPYYAGNLNKLPLKPASVVFCHPPDFSSPVISLSKHFLANRILKSMAIHMGKTRTTTSRTRLLGVEQLWLESGIDWSALKNVGENSTPKPDQTECFHIADQVRNFGTLNKRRRRSKSEDLFVVMVEKQVPS